MASTLIMYELSEMINKLELYTKTNKLTKDNKALLYDASLSIQFVLNGLKMGEKHQ